MIKNHGNTISQISCLSIATSYTLVLYHYDSKTWLKKHPTFSYGSFCRNDSFFLFCSFHCLYTPIRLRQRAFTHLFIIYPIFFYPENTCTRTNNNNNNDNERNTKKGEMLQGKGWRRERKEETMPFHWYKVHNVWNSLHYAHLVVLHIYDKCSLGYKPFIRRGP